MIMILSKVEFDYNMKQKKSVKYHMMPYESQKEEEKEKKRNFACYYIVILRKVTEIERSISIAGMRSC